jgi:hypothetical protein
MSAPYRDHLQPRDLGIGKEPTNLAAMAKAGYAASRRLLDAERISSRSEKTTRSWNPAGRRGR